MLEGSFGLRIPGEEFNFKGSWGTDYCYSIEKYLTRAINGKRYNLSSAGNLKIKIPIELESVVFNDGYNVFELIFKTVSHEQQIYNAIKNTTFNMSYESIIWELENQFRIDLDEEEEIMKLCDIPVIYDVSNLITLENRLNMIKGNPEYDVTKFFDLLNEISISDIYTKLILNTTDVHFWNLNKLKNLFDN